MMNKIIRTTLITLLLTFAAHAARPTGTTDCHRLPEVRKAKRGNYGRAIQ